MLSSAAPPRRAVEPRSLSVWFVLQPHPSRFVSVSVIARFAVAITSLLLAPTLAAAQAPPAAPVPPANADTIERVLAVVDGHPLLLSDVSDLERVRGLGEDAALEAAIDERLMFQEASRLAQTEVLKEEEERALAEVVERQPILREQVPEAGLRRILRRQITILKYVEFRFRPQLRVSDQEVRAAYEADPQGGASWEAEKDKIRDRLERRALDERIEAWVRELRARADVRYVGREPGSGGP
jgi:hypothetical protein